MTKISNRQKWLNASFARPLCHFGRKLADGRLSYSALVHVYSTLYMHTQYTHAHVHACIHYTYVYAYIRAKTNLVEFKHSFKRTNKPSNAVQVIRILQLL